MWTPELSLALALAIPAIGGVAVALLGKYPNLREGATLVSAVLLALNVAYLVEIAPSHPVLELANLAPGLHLVFRLHDTSHPVVGVDYRCPTFDLDGLADFGLFGIHRTVGRGF